MSSSAASSLRDLLPHDDLRNVRLTARWVFPIDAVPIERGLVEVIDGRISAISQLLGAADDRTIDLGPVALLPGLVNCHAHLEFSDLSGPLGRPNVAFRSAKGGAFFRGAKDDNKGALVYPFADWIGQVVSHRQTRTTALANLIANGLSEAASSGTAVIGEIATGDWSPEFAGEQPLRVVAFHESLCFLPEHVQEQLARARTHLERCRDAQANGLRVIGGLSPHAPYTVLPEMFESLIQLAEAEQVPLCMHLGETRAEMEFLQHGTGELRDMLTRIGLWRDGLHPIERRPIDFLQRLSALERALIAHGNYLEPSDWKFLAKHPQVSVVYCPRTHHYFGHSPHPWREMLAAGASVALGTDGRSSNPDYSLWQEVLWLDELTAGRERPLLLELATLRGARALGLEAEMGSLTVGKEAEFCAVPLQTGAETDPFVSVFGSR